MKFDLMRRRFALSLAAVALLASCTGLLQGRDRDHPPIVFVPGNCDSAALWQTTLWRFESNGWPHDRLFAIDLPYPCERDADDKVQEGRTSSTEHMQFLAAEVDRVLLATGARKIVLMGNSRGGYAIRNYIRYGGGADKVSRAILGATPNHGFFASAEAIGPLQPTRESNGLGPLLIRLNTPQGPNGEEVTPGVKWMTIRSDTNDWAAQPTWLFGPRKGQPTGVGYDSPELKGAENTVLPGIDHMEASFGPLAFAQAFRFVTGRAPATTAPTPRSNVALSGKVFGLGVDNHPESGHRENNLPLVGATVEIFRVDPQNGERIGAALLQQTIGRDGRWGPLTTDSRAALEFVITAPEYAVTHIYRSPFPRSSQIVHLQARVFDKDEPKSDAKIVMVRPRGFLCAPRDAMSFDGRSPPPGIEPGVALKNASVLRLTGSDPRPITADFNGERVTGHTWPTHENRLVVLELTY